MRGKVGWTLSIIWLCLMLLLWPTTFSIFTEVGYIPHPCRVGVPWGSHTAYRLCWEKAHAHGFQLGFPQSGKQYPHSEYWSEVMKTVRNSENELPSLPFAS